MSLKLAIKLFSSFFLLLKFSVDLKMPELHYVTFVYSQSTNLFGANRTKCGKKMKSAYKT